MGLNRTSRDMTIMVPIRSGFRISGGANAAANEPRSPPDAIGMRIALRSKVSNFLCRLNSEIATTDSTKIPTRFVAFATSGGIPMIIKVGSTRFEPPPATVLIAPASNATKIRIKISKPAGSMKRYPQTKARGYAQIRGTQEKCHAAGNWADKTSAP